MKTTELMIECPVSFTLSLIGGKYKPLILWHLRESAQRFGDLRRLLPQATPKVLTQQLRELETDGLLTRTAYPVIPAWVEYEMTDLGRSLLPVLRAMCEWGEANLGRHTVSKQCCNNT